MSEANLVVEVTSPFDDPGQEDWLKLEQAELEPPAANFVEWMLAQGITNPTPSQALQLAANYRSICDGNGALTVEIVVKTSRPDITYELHSDVGELSEERVFENVYAKTFAVKDAVEYLPDKPISKILEVRWLVCLVNNRVVKHGPAMRMQGGKLVWTGSATGAIRCRYLSRDKRIELTIAPADDTEDGEDSYSANVFAIWEGGVETLAVKVVSLEGTCKGSIKYSVTGPDDDDREEDERDPSEPCHDLRLTYDVCSGEEIKREIVSC